MNKTLAFAALLGAATALSTPSAFACDCGPPGSPEQSLAEASAVFEGTVVEVANETGSFTVTLLVERTWKGVESNTVAVSTARGSAACGFSFEEREKYLVFTDASDSGDLPHVGSCGRTKLSSAAAEDLEALGEGTKLESDGPGYIDGSAESDSGCSLAPGNAKSSTATGLMLLFAALWFSRRRRPQG